MWINYEDIEKLPLNDLRAFIIKKLAQNPRSSLFNLKVSDLIFKSDNIIVKGAGIYIFSDSSQENPILYVGKCSSRHFVERIPSHFDPRFNAWFNSFLKVLIKNDHTIKDDNKQEFIITKLKELFSKDSKYQFCLIEVPESFDKKKIQKMEDILRSVLDPLNKKKKGLDGSSILGDLMSEID